ncbi:MAG TPA: WbqC family protein [Burkholderiaceae bacterium]|nr:WbqC family protein [Burkholderiaceae bacterium]
MIVSIHQPAYLPWLGHFDRVARSDLHVVLDHVQFEKNSFVNRNRVRSTQGAVWLTVPVRTAGRFGRLPICQVETASTRWQRKHWATLRHCYAHTEHFAAHAGFFEQLYRQDWPALEPLLRESTGYLQAAFGIRTPVVRSSELKVGGEKSALVLALCEAVGATTYLSGPLGRDYLDLASFADAGIAVTFHDYRQPVYRQSGPGFQANLSAIDLLFNCGGMGFAELTGPLPAKEASA